MNPNDPRHGTERGYQAHKRSGTKACRPCARAAVAERVRREQERLAEELELTGGRWVPHRGVMIWQPHRTAPEPIVGSRGTLEESAAEIAAEVYRRAFLGRNRSAA